MVVAMDGTFVPNNGAWEVGVVGVEITRMAKRLTRQRGALVRVVHWP